MCNVFMRLAQPNALYEAFFEALELMGVASDVKQMPNKDGSGKGQMAAWKVSSIPLISNQAFSCK